MFFVTSCHIPLEPRDETVSDTSPVLIRIVDDVEEETVLEEVQPTQEPTTPLPTEEIIVEIEEVVEEENNQEVETYVYEIPSLVGLYEDFTIESDYLHGWYRNFFPNKIVVEECSDECSSREIENLLKPQNNEWVMVQHGNVLYTHSGWPLLTGPNFGQLFVLIRRENEEGLKESGFCLNETLCFNITNDVILGQDQVGGIVQLDEFFETEEEDFFLVTCSQSPIPGRLTPKLILRLQVQQTE